MGKILITGATGNVGSEVVKELHLLNQKTISGVSRREQLSSFAAGEAVLFDFADSSSWHQALDGADKVFLMRPPAISDVKTYLFPFIDAALDGGIKQIVFLSLQGVQFNPLTPHYKVEKYLKRKKAPYTFLRPNFFMQNLSTVYKDDIKNHDEIFLPAGRGKTAFVDVRDIGAVAAKVLSEEHHIGKAYTLTGDESLDYYQVASIMSSVLQRNIEYKNPSVKKYIERLSSLGTNKDYIKVQKMLYFVVRHNFSAGITDDIHSLLGRSPISFKQFAQDYVDMWQ